MASKLSALGWVGMAFETTFGTAVNPTVFIPYDTIKVEDDVKKIVDEARRAVLTKDFAVYNASQEGKIEFETYAYPELLGYFFKPILSNYAVTGTGAPYSHKFTVLNDLSPSLTISDYNVITERQYKGAIMEELGVKFDAEESMKVNAKFSSFGSAIAGTDTPSFNVGNPFMGFSAVLTVGGTPNHNLVGGEINIKREAKLLHTANNTLDPSKYSTGRLEATFKFTFDIDDESEFLLYKNGSMLPLDITFTRDANTSIDFSFGKVAFSKATIDRSQEFLRCEVEGFALFNATDAGMMTVTLKNAVATY